MSHWDLQRGKPGWMGRWWHVIFWTISINFNWKMGGFHSHGGTPKWIVYFMENTIKMEDLGAISGNFHISQYRFTFDELWAFRSWPVDYILEYVFIHVCVYIYICICICIYIYIYVCMYVCIYIYWSYPPVSPFTAHRTRWNGAGGGSRASKKRRPRGTKRGPHHRWTIKNTLLMAQL